jgi:predicted RNA-binding protein (virulence factor B family)
VPSDRETLLEQAEIAKLQVYLRKLFRLDTILLAKRPKKEDSVEVMVGDEFIGLVYKDEEDGETSYHFEMCILEMDLPE